jgi:hypothetical protein
MNTPARLSARLPRGLAAIALAAAPACTADIGRNAAVQAWWKGLGPVIPHDTFPADCSLCHTSDGWRAIRADFAFDHARETGRALEGAHARAQCLRCHNDRGPVREFAARGCGGCHVDPHAGDLGAACAACHGEDNWRVSASIEAHERTRFPLVGGHASAACHRCHPNAQAGEYAPVDTACVACHAADVARASAPDHAAQGWGDGCERCHAPIGWTGDAFSHSAWPLLGRHRALACNDCHPSQSYAGTSADCFTCHKGNYNGAQSPDHVTLAFPTDCSLCHTPNGWHGARFAHAGVVSGCADCHLADYYSAPDPDHGSLGFSTVCEECHASTRHWSGAAYDHPYFPIDHGQHAGYACSDCHVVPGDFGQFSCTHCHAHRAGAMQSEHAGVAYYAWESGACYGCHTDGHAD